MFNYQHNSDGEQVHHTQQYDTKEYILHNFLTQKIAINLSRSSMRKCLAINLHPHIKILSIYFKH